MKVCVLTTSFPRFKGDSAGIFIYHLCRWLSDKGVDIEVIAPHHPYGSYHENLGSIRINRFSYFYPPKYQKLCYEAGVLKNIRSNPTAAIQLPFFIVAETVYSLIKISKKKFDLIHAHWSIPQGLLGILNRYLKGIPCVTTFHGSDIYGLQSVLLKNINAKVIRHSDACTANSKATAEKAGEISGAGNFSIIPMGVDTQMFKRTGDISELKQRFRISGKVILFVGRLIDLKGVSYLIKAVPAILQQFPETKIMLVGSGPQRSELVGRVNDLKLERNFVFIDKVPHHQLVRYYSLADIFVLPSIISDKGETEGLGMVLLEAMACGTPVVGSNIGGIQDIIYDGRTGLLADQKDSDCLAEKICILLSDTRLRQNVIENGLRLVNEKYSWEVVSEKFLSLYKDVIEKNKRMMRF